MPGRASRWATGVMAKDRDGDNLTYSLREFVPVEDDTTTEVNENDPSWDIDGIEDMVANHKDDYEMFEIDQVTGQISLAQGTSLNFEGQSVYIVTVLVTDPFYGQSIAPDASLPTTGPAADAFDTIDLIIEVVDVDENPSVPADVTGNRRTAGYTEPDGGGNRDRSRR